MPPKKTAQAPTLSDDQRKAAIDKALLTGKPAKQAGAKVHNVASENKKAAKSALGDKPNVKSEEKAPENRMSARERLDAFGIDALVEAILSPMPQHEIAKAIGVSPGSLVAWIAADPERLARAREARAQTALMWDDKATAVIEEAQDQFELAKAKELAHHYRWRAAKIAPREYGDKIDLNHGGQAGNPVQTTTRVVMVPAKEKAVVETRPLDQQADE
jgi:hypothetical protein